MITDTYVSFETAKLLKEKGFYEPCRAAYKSYGSLSAIEIKTFLTNKECGDTCWSCTAPTQSSAMQWLREVHNLHFSVQPVVASARTEDTEDVYYVEFYEYDVSPNNYKGWHSRSYLRDESYNSYEEACEAAIKYCLENLI